MNNFQADCRDFKRKIKGYIALTSAIIVGGLIVVIALTVGLSVYLGRANISNAYFKEKSRALSLGCFEVARFKLASSSSYTGGETIPAGSDSCQIVSVTSGSGQYVVKTQGQFQRSFSDFQFTISSANLSLVNWQELAHF